MAEATDISKGGNCSRLRVVEGAKYASADYFPRSTIPEENAGLLIVLKLLVIYMANRLACPWELYFYLTSL